MQDIERIKGNAPDRRADRARSCARSSSASTASATSCCIRREGQEPVQGPARAQGLQSGDRHRGDQAEVMRGLSVPSALIDLAAAVQAATQTSSAIPTTSTRRRSCWRRPAIRRLRAAHGLPERSLRQRRGDLPGGGGMLARIGVKVKLNAQPKAQVLRLRRRCRRLRQLVQPARLDAGRRSTANVLANIVGFRDAKGTGSSANYGGYCNSAIDELTKTRSSRRPTRPSATR